MELASITTIGTVTSTPVERHLVRNGKLAKTWNYSDIFGLVAQLDAP